MTEAPQAPNDAKGNATAPTRTKAEDRYVDAVADGSTLDAALLELGQEACDRANYVGQLDEGALVKALESDEIGAADKAIPYLCPEEAPALAEARGGVVDGTWKVGTDIGVGTYDSVNPGDGCAWVVSDADGKVLSSGKAGDGEVSLGSNAAQFRSKDCVIWLPLSDG
ncbi:hypothetical protein [Cellulomonas sp. PhB143]|uniref:hypothetical protein n=1 Tax=Cellulomonas sp. PhB143 TaxID=2485186 RepID=UPI000F49F17C|nr:hypothetical protein [Cellulomonas sp. PhB143]ROS78681.1 hypothetical protein EDF32_0583 [Cellulomonas sp. PhB143]